LIGDINFKRPIFGEEENMKKKIIGMFVCMLVIGTTGIAVADWVPSDGHKMHFPQMPDPVGWDVNFHDFYLADDWQCTETGPVTDIHFWISWRHDIVGELPYIKIAIYSNNPQGPGGYSQPLEQLWVRTFTPDQFIIAGPWSGDQGWLEPYGGYFLHDHLKYYQINIKNIDQPFTQQNHTIYWLVIQMPYMYPIEIGWKTSKNSFMDAAVWGSPGQWTPIIDPVGGNPINLAFVITGYEEEECCLAIESMSGGLLGSPSLLTVKAVIKNTGTAECKNITWNFSFLGGIVLWGPKSGTVASLLPGDIVTVSSRIVIGLAIPGILPGNVTITADAANNACGAVSMEKEIFLFILLFKVIP
jgi:hypothetical protein